MNSDRRTKPTRLGRHREALEGRGADPTSEAAEQRSRSLPVPEIRRKRGRGGRLAHVTAAAIGRPARGRIWVGRRPRRAVKRLRPAPHPRRAPTSGCPARPLRSGSSLASPAQLSKAPRRPGRCCCNCPPHPWPYAYLAPTRPAGKSGGNTILPRCTPCWEYKFILTIHPSER